MRERAPGPWADVQEGFGVLEFKVSCVKFTSSIQFMLGQMAFPGYLFILGLV